MAAAEGARKAHSGSIIRFRYFLSSAISVGCTKPQALNAKNISAACLNCGSRWYLSSIRIFLRFAYRAGYTDRDYSGIVPPFRRPQPYPSVYTIKEIRKIEASIDLETSHGKRDRAALLLATRLGIRNGDISAMTFKSLNFSKSLILLT